MQAQAQEAPRVAGRTLVPVDDLETYLRYAREAGRPGAALPVIAGHWERLRTTLATLPTVSEVSRKPWHGAVFVQDDASGAEDAAYAAVGELLAEVTGRPLLRGGFEAALAHSLREPATLVAGVAAVTPEQFASLPHDARLGLFVTRSAAAASALAVRTVLHGPAAAADWDDLSFDAVTVDAPTPRRLVGVAATPVTLREAIGPGVAMLAGRSHARDCVMHLNGGGICGRAEPDPQMPLPLSAADAFRGHPTSCQQGAGCWRADVEVEQHVRAAEVRAAFAVLDGCRLAVAGEGPVMADVSVPLSMLEGTAVAVATGTGIRKGAGHAGQLFQGLMRGGLPLGRALAEVNGVIEAEPDAMGRLVLFGDAGLAPVPDGTLATVACPPGPGGAYLAAGPAAVLVEGGPVLADDAAGPVTLARLDGVSSWALTGAAGRGAGRVLPVRADIDRRWARRVSPWLDRLRGLQDVGVQGDFTALDEVRRTAAQALHARATATRAAEALAALDAFDQAVRDLTAFQSRLVRAETDWIAGNFSSYVDGWRRPWLVRADDEPRDCPQCGSRTVTAHLVRPSAGAAGELLYLICARCGEVAAGSPETGVGIEVLLPSEVPRGTDFALGVALSAPADRPVTVAVGAAVSNEPLVHCRLHAHAEVELRAGERKVVEFTGRSDAVKTRPDQHPLKVVVAADGAVRCLTRGLWLRA
ncbi:hypothetical protein [Streptomyces spectabilis]|uniref:Uncharacterized protein n=1 Tax=Streptomyces spectabilis TaxID=68270 RepID=A0A5P2X386_STRST|nr:hypothetical protein [Streptomyces spectabilis]MBB5108901.1 hypothetical protein [Streptomyces spectabilis]MCI3899805.1 hypothetical protein [Streptomyces spectabilis]QEV57470.1 hypothetical protein CP982_00935 [Streptomyces spectabilis]GGV42815.1 hypothetical protein GCM10010245_67220 [Streptomyces spectabilis]